ncbi:hypothetical protein ACWIG5_05160 [Streptomyces lydicus]
MNADVDRTSPGPIAVPWTAINPHGEALPPDRQDGRSATALPPRSRSTEEGTDPPSGRSDTPSDVLGEIGDELLTAVRGERRRLAFDWLRGAVGDVA